MLTRIMLHVHTFKHVTLNVTQNRFLFSDNQFDNTIKRRPSNEKVLSGLV